MAIKFQCIQFLNEYFKISPTFEIFVTLAMATTCKELLLSSFAINSVVCGYHVYKDIWISACGKELNASVRMVMCMICVLFPL